MNDTMWMVLTVVAAVLIIGAIGWFYFRQVNPKKDAVKDAKNRNKRALRVARRFARSNGFHYIAPAALQNDERKANLDALVIGSFGVLGVKALGYNGQIYSNDGDREWLQVVDDERRFFDSPVSEALSDVRVIQNILLKNNIKQTPVQVLCVFTDPKVELLLSGAGNCFTVKKFKQILNSDKFLESSIQNTDIINDVLTKHIK